uniref:phosphoribulokinase n=1 Tax=uncultured Thiotrichaceae bacterium TaxID=298394 RepID=A0A6S6T0B4_9GAMM|nr:MAG: Phosphoribulokinase [uncultured Thiotrichaceae bacterium]
MSAEFPIVAITGASDHSSTSITQALQRIFYRERIKASYIPGSGFHRFEREQMRKEVKAARSEDRPMSHFGPEGNHLDKLESMFFEYAATGNGKYRYYLHSDKVAQTYKQASGTFTPWADLDPDSDLLLYRGLHGAMIDGDIDLSQYPDLLVGAAPSVNLEWMRRRERDLRRGYSQDDVKEMTLERMADYAKHLTPQFTRTDINFQLIPVVDTSNPFDCENLPTEDECILVIHFQKKKIIQQIDMIDLLNRIPDATMTRRDTMLIPGSQMLSAVEIILMPLIENLIRRSREIKGITAADIPEDRGAGILGMLGQLK